MDMFMTRWSHHIRLLMSIALLCSGHALENPIRDSSHHVIDALFEESLTMIGYCQLADSMVPEDKAILLSPEEQMILGYYPSECPTMISEPVTDVDAQQEVSSNQEELPAVSSVITPDHQPGQTTSHTPDLEAPKDRNEPESLQTITQEPVELPSVDKRDSVTNYLEHATHEVVLKAPVTSTRLVAYHSHPNVQIPDQQRLESAEILAQLTTLSINLYWRCFDASLHLYGNNLGLQRKIIKKIGKKEQKNIRLIAKRLRTLGYHLPAHQQPKANDASYEQPQLIIAGIHNDLESIISFIASAIARISSEQDPATHQFLISLLAHYQETLSCLMIEAD